MSMTRTYAEVALTREEIDGLDGPVLLEFGTAWCGYCRAAQPLIEQALAGHPGVRHIKVEDGKGRALGRSFSVRLWPTLVFLLSGDVRAKLVRPDSAQAIERALAELDAQSAAPGINGPA